MTVCICAIISLLFLFIDQFTKAWAAAGTVNQDFLGSFIRFVYSENRGMAFGIFNNNPNAMQIITALTVFMIIGIVVLMFTLFRHNKPAQITLAIIESGAIGNLIDRLVLNYVRDFVDVSKLGFGICNIADFCITLGAVALVIIILFVGKDAVFPLGKYRKLAKEEREEKK